jgi:KDO transferase-3
MSLSPAVGIARATSVACAALQVAWLMRFNEVRIYGMDLGGPARFYAEGAQAEPSGLDQAYETALLPWFKEFAARCCGPEFRVFNCSDSSRLPADVLPRRDPNAP